MKKNFNYFLKQIKENQAPTGNDIIPREGGSKDATENSVHPYANEIIDRYNDLIASGQHTSIGSIEVIANALDMNFSDVWEIVETDSIDEDVFKIQKPTEDSFINIKNDKGTCSVCNAENVTIANHVCMTPIAEAVSMKAIEKKVEEINKMIELAIDSDGDPIGVVDTSGTWQSRDYYSPIKFVNGVLYIEYKEQDNKINKDKILKRDMEFDGIPTLNNIAKMYRKALKDNVKVQNSIDENKNFSLETRMFSDDKQDIKTIKKICYDLGINCVTDYFDGALFIAIQTSDFDKIKDKIAERKIHFNKIEKYDKTGKLINEKVSAEAQEFISDNIKKLIDNGVPQKQAIAISYSQAKKKGFKIPKNPNDKKNVKDNEKNEMVTTHIEYKKIK